jgi:hypothetical protein
MQPLWTWGGAFFGHRDGDDLWTYDGRHVGRFSGDEIYGPDGRYLGEIVSTDCLITCLIKIRWTKFSFTPRGDRTGGAPEPRRSGFLLPAGYKDFPFPSDVLRRLVV